MGKRWAAPNSLCPPRQRLAGRQQPVLAVNVAGGQVSPVRLRPDIEQIHVPMQAIWDVWSRWRIAEIMRERRPDIVQTYMAGPVD